MTSRPVEVVGPGREDLPPYLWQQWGEWLKAHCTIRKHAAHLRYQCAESREQALRGCVELNDPDESDRRRR